MRTRGRPAKRTRPELEPYPEARARILEAAEQLFAERAFGGAGTRDIAALAGVNQGLIAYHFGGKEALFREVVQRGLAALAEALEAAAHPTPLERWLAALADHRRLLQIAVHALVEPGPRRDWLVAQFPALVRRLRAAIGPGAEPPGVRADVSLLTFAAASGALAAFAPALESATGRTLDPERALHAQRDLLDAWFVGARAAGPWSPRHVR